MVLVVLLIFGAFVLDLGVLYNSRRQNQNAADSQPWPGPLSPSDLGILQAVDEKASNTLGVNVGTIDWTACALATTTVDDPDKRRSRHLQLHYDELIRCSPGEAPGAFGRRRVRPGRRQEQLLAHRVRYRRDATVGLGSVLPFGLPASAAGDNAACLKDGPASRGARATAPILATSATSTSPDTAAQASPQRSCATATSMSASVRTSRRASTTTSRPTRSRRPDGSLTTPNVGIRSGKPRVSWVRTETRPRHSATDLLRTGFRGQPARLAQSSADLPWATRQTIESHDLDDNPLWQFIEPIDGDRDGDISVPDSPEERVSVGSIRELLIASHDSRKRAELHFRSSHQQGGDAFDDRPLLHPLPRLASERVARSPAAESPAAA